VGNFFPVTFSCAYGVLWVTSCTLFDQTDVSSGEIGNLNHLSTASRSGLQPSRPVTFGLYVNAFLKSVIGLSMSLLLVFSGSSSYASAPACAGVPPDGKDCLLLHHILLEQALFSMSRFEVSSFQVFFSPALVAAIEVHPCHPFMSYKGKYEGVFPWHHQHRPRVGFPSKIIIESNPHSSPNGELQPILVT
jgi:hypothetical protein